MAQLIWTDPAILDVEEIAQYIALDNYNAAQKLVQNIFVAVERLEKHPLSGRKPPELEKSLYREIIIGPCRIFYKIVSDKVYIIYVMRAERMLRKYLLNERTIQNIN
jgi:toxin ParE1/3/4